MKTQRVKIVTGLKCNIKCIFCYYRDNLNIPNKNTDQVLSDIEYAYRHGVREVDFSGGEPTIHPDLFRFVVHAKQIGMKKVCIITNGWRLADHGYCNDLKNAGLDEVLFSVHGSNADIHDRLTDVPGSFERIARGLGNASKCGLVIRTNTVVSRINIHDIQNVCSFVVDYKPLQVNFITVNDWCYAKNLVDELMLKYSEMAPHLKMACDFLEDVVPAVNVRYIPFCFMQGYERFVCNHRQVPYDPFEWVQRVRARLEEGTGLLRYLAILGYGLFVAGEATNLFRKKTEDLLDSAVTEGLRHRFYSKAPCCKSCKYTELCDGVEKTYAREFGFYELMPQSGELICDPIHYRREINGENLEA